jgi:hypothetical protein
MAVTSPPRLVPGFGEALERRSGGLPQTLRAFTPRRLTAEGIVTEQHIREGRFQRSLSVIAGLSSLLAGYEVTTEHIRGSYGQRIMYSPVFLSPLLAIVGIWAAFSRRVARTLLPITSAVMLLDAVVGFFFHIRGVQRKPGGWRLPVFNIVMGPPLFAPLLFGISGFLGLIASFLRREDDPAHTLLPGLPRPRRSSWTRFVPRAIAHEGLTFEHELREGRFQRGLAFATGVSAVLNGMEALYSHYRNAFLYPIQWTPVLLAPIMAVVSFAAVFSRRVAHTLLPVVSVVAILDGVVGFGYHIRGVWRQPTHLREWLHSLVYGPPVFAPLLFAASGFLGVLASLLRREK